MQPDKHLNMYRYICPNVYRCASTSRPSSTIAALLIQQQRHNIRDACRQVVHTIGRGQAAPTTLTSSPERFGANSCTRMPGGHFHVLLSRTDEQPCNQMETEGRSTSPSRRSTWPSRRRSRSTRSRTRSHEDASYAGTTPLMGARFRLALEQQADEHRRDHGPIAARQGQGIKALVHSC